MLLVKTYLGKSKLHGLGVFAGQFIRKGTKIWRFVEGFDRFYTLKQFARLPKPAKEYIKWHGFRWEDEVPVLRGPRFPYEPFGRSQHLFA
jgi:hypothetical protein